MIVHRASEYGRCIRASVAARLGMKKLPTDDRMAVLYERGNAHEEACIAVMVEMGGVIDDQQREVRVKVADGIVVQGHLDGVLWPNGSALRPARVLEIKSPPTYRAFEKAYKTADWSNPYMSCIAWQVSCYQVATGLECVMACLDGDVVKMFGIEMPIHTREEIVQRVLTIEDYINHGGPTGGTSLPDTCSQADYPCPFAYLHDERTITPIDDPAIIDDAREYLKWGAQEKLAKAAREKLRDQLLARLQVGTYQTGDAVTTVYEQGSSRWDETALVAKYGPEVLDFKVAGEKTPRLKVT